MHDVRVEVTPRLDGQAVDVRGNVVKARLLQDLNLNEKGVISCNQSGQKRGASSALTAST